MLVNQHLWYLAPPTHPFALGGQDVVWRVLPLNTLDPKHRVDDLVVGVDSRLLGGDVGGEGDRRVWRGSGGRGRVRWCGRVSAWLSGGGWIGGGLSGGGRIGGGRIGGGLSGGGLSGWGLSGWGLSGGGLSVGRPSGLWSWGPFCGGMLGGAGWRSGAEGITTQTSHT